MKLLLDTNVLVAAFISRGMCHELFEHVAVAHEMVTSKPLLAEFREKLVSKFHFTDKTARKAARLVGSRAEIVKVPARIESVCRDADDDVVLASAVAGCCKVIVTGDQDLLVLREHEGVRIIRPSEFWAFESV